MKIILGLLVLVGTLSGCATVTADRITAADQQGQLHAGMDFQEIAAIVGRQPSSLSDVYEETHEGDATLIKWVVNGKCDAQGALPLYRFYELKFKNNKLISWSWHK